MNQTVTPAHIPKNLIKNYDFYDMKGETDVHLHFKKLHDGPDIFYTPCYGGHWVVTRHKQAQHILNNPEDFSSHHGSIPTTPFPVPLLEFDGSLHNDFRKLVTPFFTPKNIKRFEGIANELTISLIDDFYEDGECEFIAAFAQKMPIIIAMGLLDLPAEDTDYLMKISDDIVRSGSTEMQVAAFDRVIQYFATKIIPARSANPGEDLISAVIKGKVEDGRSITPEELTGLCVLLIAAGLDTVAGMLGFITLFLAKNPDHRQQLVDDPEIINDALEELLRRHHIINIARVATRDLEIDSVSIKQGEIIMVPITAAGIDNHRYSDPLTVDFQREDKKHIAFGGGAHQCIGSFLARTELRVFLREWLKRIPDFQIKEGEQPIAQAGKACSVRYLPLSWKV